MSDNITAPAAGAILATDEIANVHFPKTKIVFGGNGTATDITPTDRLPVRTQDGLATEAKQDAMISAIENISPGSGGGGDASAANQVAVQANAGADATKATAVQFITGGKAFAVTGTFWQATQPVSGTVGISGSVAVTGPLTDTQLRASALPVSIGGSVAVTGSFFQATQPVSIAATVAVSGPLTDTQLRAAAVPVSAASLPLPTGAATEAKQDALIALSTLPAGTDRSGSITAGGTAQQLAAANANRKSLTVQNISDADLWINEIGDSAAVDTAGSWKIPAGSAFSVSTNRAVSIISATTGKKFTATEI